MIRQVVADNGMYIVTIKVTFTDVVAGIFNSASKVFPARLDEGGNKDARVRGRLIYSTRTILRRVASRRWLSVISVFVVYDWIPRAQEPGTSSAIRSPIPCLHILHDLSFVSARTVTVPLGTKRSYILLLSAGSSFISFRRKVIIRKTIYRRVSRYTHARRPATPRPAATRSPLHGELMRVFLQSCFIAHRSTRRQSACASRAFNGRVTDCCDEGPINSLCRVSHSSLKTLIKFLWKKIVALTPHTNDTIYDLIRTCIPILLMRRYFCGVKINRKPIHGGSAVENADGWCCIWSPRARRPAARINDSMYEADSPRHSIAIRA